MSYRVLLLIPEGLTFDLLTEEQRTAIRSVFGQYVLPMPGSVAIDGFVICDAVTSPSFNPATMVDFNLSWEIIGMWQDDGSVIIPLDETKFTERLAPVTVYDEEGALLSSQPALFHEPHRWAGWPALIGI